VISRTNWLKWRLTRELAARPCLEIQKQIKILENRLDKALVKYNEALAHNKQLRQTIDNLRRERLVFDQIYKKLEKAGTSSVRPIASST